MRGIVHKVVLFTTVFLVAQAACAETITLKDGQKVSGRIIRSDERSIFVELDSGGYKAIPKSDIIADKDAQGAGAVKAPVRLPALAETISALVDKIQGGVLRPAIIARVDGKKVYIDVGASEGVLVGDEFEIVRARTETAGTDKNVKTVTARDVAGRLRVTSIQPALSVCELVSGAAEARDARGEYNQVQKKRRACIEGIHVPAGLGVTEDDLLNGLAEAVGRSERFELVNEARADAHLRIEAAAAENGIKVVLSLTDSASRRVISTAEAVRRTSLSASDFGFMSAVSVPLGTQLNTLAVRKALEGAFGAVRQAGPALYVPRTGSGGESAWVFPDGTIVVAAGDELLTDRQPVQLSLAWTAVGNAVASVTATLEKATFSEILRTKSQVYTAKALQYQFLLLTEGRYGRSSGGIQDCIETGTAYSQAGEGGFERVASLRDAPSPPFLICANTTDIPDIILQDRRCWEDGGHRHPVEARTDDLEFAFGNFGPTERDVILSWPDAAPGWATISGLPVRSCNVYLEGRQILGLVEQPAARGGLPASGAGIRERLFGGSLYSQAPRQRERLLASYNLVALQYGEHLLKISWGGDGAQVAIEAFFPEPNGKIVLCDSAKKPVASVSVYSQALSSLYLPVPEGFLVPSK